MMKNQKGITLIALVITIIVLLILAGVTIAMLTGSDSAPQKANEAKQKQDIGAAKDQVYIWAQEYQTTAYENVYVKGLNANGNAGLATGRQNKADNIGSYVGGQLVSSHASGKVGLASIAITNATSTEDISNSEMTANNATCTITITTTDFKLVGYIDKNAGKLVWQDGGIKANS